MRIISLPVLTIILLLAFSACREAGPLISYKDSTFKPDTTYLDMNLPADVVKRVLIEEFTGVACVYCPEGAEVIKDILSAHPDSVIAIAIHNDNALARPFSGSADFRTPEGILISQKLKGSSFLPCAGIDRKHFPGQGKIAMIRSQWKNAVENQLMEEPSVSLELISDFNTSSREFIVEVRLHFLKSIDSTIHLSLFLIEDSIVNPQKFPFQVLDTHYVHNHILRGMVTPVFGIQVHDTTEAGRVIIKYFKYTVPPGWREDHLKIVAAVHRIGSTDLVLQAREAKVK